MTTYSAMLISANYPENILIDARQNNITGKWTSAMYLLKDGNIHYEIVSFNGHPFETKDIAVSKMEKVVEVCRSIASGKEDKQ